MKFTFLILLLICSVSFANSLEGIKILFDESHAQGYKNADWFMNTSFSDWADALASEGAEVNSIDSDWILSVISEFDVFVIPEPLTPFTETEKLIIAELFRLKKGVFILTNPASAEDGTDSPAIVNDLLTEYGIQCTADNYRATPLNGSYNADSGFIYSDDKMYCWSSCGFTGNIKTAVTSGTDITVLAYADISGGRLILCGDTEIFGDGSGTAGDKLYNDYSFGTHKRMSVNIIRYLAGSSQSGVTYSGSYTAAYTQMKKLEGTELFKALHSLVSNHKPVGYDTAKELMFGKIDNVSGQVHCVYTNLVMNCNGIPDQNIMNTEHTWPQSHFTQSEAATKKCDLHHLFPTEAKANGRRGNNPFGYVEDITWQTDNSKLGKDSHNRIVFEPPAEHRGNVARALFYFAVRYNQKIDSYEEEVLREWNVSDPVDEAERKRNDAIYKYQVNRNPFIDHPEFIDKITDF